MAVGYQLEVQMLVQLVPVLCVNVPLTITLHAVDVLIAECLSWFAIVARYDNESAQYVCELCQKQGKAVGSKQLIENDDSEKSLPDVEFQNLSSDTMLLSQAPRGDGKKCAIPDILMNNVFRRKHLKKTENLMLAWTHLMKCPSFIKHQCQCPRLMVHRPLCQLVHLHLNGALSSLPASPPPPMENCKKKFSWFVAPNFEGSSGVEWKVADGPFDPLQYQQQTGGCDISISHLENVFSQEGPFDGILGFSQGAAMTAVISAQQEKLKGKMDFKFVVLCSGFALHLKEMECSPIKCPSLHIFGNEHGQDRQIANQTSKELASLYDSGCSVIVEHDCGHIIPTRSPYIDEIKAFLGRFLLVKKLYNALCGRGCKHSHLLLHQGAGFVVWHFALKIYCLCHIRGFGPPRPVRALFNLLMARSTGFVFVKL
ncbi:hypothetical protein L195_g021241 [Trifolium pratense]|uniref:Serine hydrolase domain-containing protein n=1 Tax=Trifolium pratense TaxID=57577 RepID=A0A2K3N4M3_TRIPR|nr:hypothetical protein L195_g021241 [Trifolium pratense]